MAKAKKGYGQFCPVAQAAEIVAERWTPLVLRELLSGSTRFNDLRKGVPLMSPSLLSQRLKTLERAGIVQRQPGPEGVGYHLTPAGRELQPLVEALGLWGYKWVRRKLTREDLDPRWLMWDVHRCIDVSRLPSRRVVIQFDMTGVHRELSRWWLVCDRNEVDLCLTWPGYEVDLGIAASIRTLVDAWLGYTGMADALSTGAIQLQGSPELARGFTDWFGPGMLARLARSKGVLPARP